MWKMVKVQCIKCNREGSLTKKQTKSKGRTYVYWYVEHHIGDKIKWCYLGKYDKLPEEYKRLIHKDTQTASFDTQSETIEVPTSNNLKNYSISESKSLATSLAQGPTYSFFTTSPKYSFHEISNAIFHKSYFSTRLLYALSCSSQYVPAAFLPQILHFMIFPSLMDNWG